jgi:methionyl-tRNA formyltransferase
VPSLKALCEDPAFSIEAVYCMPDKPKGRGKKTAMTPVKEFALSRGLEVCTPSSFKKFPEEIEKLATYKPDFLVVVAYGLILTQQVLDIPTIAAVNLHASLLPKFRGPSPIHHAILEGENKTGNTVMLMNSKMDEGDMLAVNEVEICPSETVETLHDKLCYSGSPLLISALKGYAKKEITPKAQDHAKATYTCKISPQMAEIDWQASATCIEKKIRAMNPFPGAWFNHNNDRIKVYSAKVSQESTNNALPGTLLKASPNEGLIIACGNGSSISLLELQKPGRGKLPVKDFLLGFKFQTGKL